MPRFSAIEFFSGIGGWHSACKGLLSDGDVDLKAGYDEVEIQKQTAELSNTSNVSSESRGGGGGGVSSNSSESSSNKQQHSNSQSQLQIDIVHAFDINPLCNDVYHHNYSKKPSGKSIQSLKAIDFERTYIADIWLMSPPCQPFTRNRGPEEALAGVTDLNDNRCGPLQSLIDAIDQLSEERLPKLIALENVVGFEISQACKLLLSVLSKRHYVFEQYILNPVQFGIPNERPRYYLIAISRQSLMKTPPPDIIKSFGFSDNIIMSEITTPLSSNLNRKVPRTVGDFLAKDLDQHQMDNLLIPREVLAKSSSWCLDIVTADSRSTSCYTKSYARFARGTGSVLLLNDVNSSMSRSSGSSSSSSSSSSNECIDSNYIYDSSDSGSKRPCIEQYRDIKDSSSLSILSGRTALTVSDSSSISSLTSNPFERVDPASRLFNSQWYLMNTDSSTSTDNSADNSADTSGTTSATGTSSSTIPASVSVRYFSPVELLKIFGFPLNFKFPTNLSNRKCYEMIGNSVNVTVITIILQRAFANLILC